MPFFFFFFGICYLLSSISGIDKVWIKIHLLTVLGQCSHTEGLVGYPWFELPSQHFSAPGNTKQYVSEVFFFFFCHFFLSLPE